MLTFLSIGTDWHKRILKDYITGENFEKVFLPGIFQTLTNAVEQELKFSKNNQFPDLFHLVRRIVLRATWDDFVSPLLLKNDPDLLEELMIFQDKVEDATAKAAVFPRILALPVCLWPTQKARGVLRKRLSRTLSSIWDKTDESMGPWLKTYVKEKTPPAEAAELLIGLVFAAHKNPAIGASQCICYLKSEMTKMQQEKALQEAKYLCSNLSSKSCGKVNLREELLKAKTLRACVLETLRLTAHTIGALRYAEQPVEVHMTTEESSSKKSHVIPRGETVALAHHCMHMEPAFWGTDADKFSLERPEWKSDNPDLGIPVDNYKLTTFSNGIHRCPGERVALAVVEMLVAILIEMDIQIVGKLAPISFERATLAQREGAMPVKFGSS